MTIKLKIMRRLLLLFTLLFASNSSWAAAANNGRGTNNFYTEVILVLFLVVVLLLIVALVLLKTVSVMAGEIKSPTQIPIAEPAKMLEYHEWEASQESVKSSKPSIWAKLMGLRPLSEEKDMMLEHDFDGITELDNPTPAWFNVLFYGSILFGAVYLLNYHVFKWSPLQDEEYVIEMKVAEVEKAAYLAKAGNLIDENSVKVDNSPEIIAAGKAVYVQNCVACHLADGGGSVGPNLTDEFWIHGGTISSIFKTIKYGVPEKGMIAWEKTLTAKQTADLSNFILSLKGTKPANPKEPQGVQL
jgi:cytochrome c oxidase cbb3-type subunit 3